MRESSNHPPIFLKVCCFVRPMVPLLPSGARYSLLQNSLKFSYGFNWNPCPGAKPSGASLKVHIFPMSWYQKKPSILGESRASRADSCVFQVSLKITSSLSYQSLKIRRRNNRGNLLVFVNFSLVSLSSRCSFLSPSFVLFTPPQVSDLLLQRQSATPAGVRGWRKLALPKKLEVTEIETENPELDSFLQPRWSDTSVF